MKLYRTPGGYQTIIEGPLFKGACDLCWGEGCYLHPMAGRVTCISCEGWGSEEKKIKGIAEREACRKKEMKTTILMLLYFIVIPLVIFILSGVSK